MLKKILSAVGLLLVPVLALASGDSTRTLDLTSHAVGYWAIGFFVFAYVFVIAEEFTHLRKSKPVIIAAGLIWAIIAGVYASESLIPGNEDLAHAAEVAIRHNFLEFSELMLFLLVAMTYINAMEERNVFAALRAWLVSKNYSLRQLFWMTGVLAFFISPIADNLTTALLMCAVVMAVGGENKKFIGIACVNIVVAANAGGAFSPFGDITTLMVWQKGNVEFATFFALFIPSVVNFMVPATIMSFFIGNEKPESSTDVALMKRGSKRIVVLFLLTIMTAVGFHQFFHLPPVIGMMTGLSYLQLFSYYIKMTGKKTLAMQKASEKLADIDLMQHDDSGYDIFKKISRAEWDTLFFFYGVVLCVGGLGFIGYLSLLSESIYIGLGPTYANVLVGFISAIVDNIPVMFAVLTMNPEMSQGQWLLVTLTAGVGGSLLSVGSAAGVALMGQAKGKYTFFGHLKWAPAIALGYGASIYVHMWVNASYFT